MNTKLSASVQSKFLEAYNCYDSRANVKFYRAVEEFAGKTAKGESPDVLPLYTATFLHYAAGVSRSLKSW